MSLSEFCSRVKFPVFLLIFWVVLPADRLKAQDSGEFLPDPSLQQPTFLLSLVDTTNFANEVWDFQNQIPSIRQSQSHQAREDSDTWLHQYYQKEDKEKASVLSALLQAHYSRITSLGLAKGVSYSDIMAKCRRSLTLCSQRDPTSIVLRFALGNLDYFRGDKYAALAHFRQAAFLLSWKKEVELEVPRHLKLAVWSQLAWSCRELALWDEAMMAIDSGLAIKKSYPSLLLVKGLVLAGSGRGAEAMSFAVRMPPLKYRHTSSNSMGFRRRANNFGNRWIKSQVLLYEGDFSGAVHVLGDLEAEKSHRLPFIHQFWTDVGLVHELAGDDRAVGMYSEWKNYFFYFMPTRIGTLEAVVLDYPHKDVPFITCENNYYLAGSPFGFLADQMNRMAEAPLEAEREEARLRALGMVQVLFRRGVPAGLCHAFRGRILMLGGATNSAGPDLRAAHAAFEAAGKLDSGTNLLLGLVEMLGGNSNRAEILFREALADAPNQTSLWKNLAIACSRNGQVELALEAMDRALELDSDSSAAWYNRGVINFNQGHFDEALVDLEKAWSLDPGNQRISTLLQRVANSRREQVSFDR